MNTIHLLPTDKPSRLIYNDANQLCYQSNKSFKNDRKNRKKFNIYITSDEEIKEDDYMYDIDGDVGKAIGSDMKEFEGNKKIILTTDQDLIADGIQAIDDKFLEWFVNNPSCEFVKVNKEWNEERIINGKDIGDYSYKIIIPKEEPKQETLEEAAYNYAVTKRNRTSHLIGFREGAKWQAERMYSEEDMIAIVEKSKATGLTAEYLLLTEQFKKK
jgi:hypothetical protein